MAEQSQSYDFSIPRFSREFFENYVIPMRDGKTEIGIGKEMRVSLRRRTIFGRKSNESERERTRVTLGQSSPSHLYDDISLPRERKGGNEQDSR